MLMATGNLAVVRDQLAVGEIVDYAGASELNAEIVPGVEPGWYVVETHPNQERVAAAHFVGRRFGVFVPEKEETIVRRGRKVEVTRLLFTGYAFIFVWDIERHFRRITAIPGVLRVICQTTDDKPVPFKVSDELIDRIRAVENHFRPLPAVMLEDSDAVGGKKKKKARWRRTPKTAKELAAEGANDIVGVRPWSAFEDALISLDEAGRNQTLQKALGLPS